MTQEKVSSLNEGRLLNILHKISTLEWVNCRSQFPRIWENNEIKKSEVATSDYPFIAFRFENEVQEIIDCLKTSIKNYQGLITWELHEHKRENLFGTNWVIRPAKCSEVGLVAKQKNLSIIDYIAQYEPKFTSIAFDDLNHLTDYLDRELNNYLKINL